MLAPLPSGIGEPRLGYPDLNQWRIQDFPEGVLFDQLFLKTAWKWRNFSPEGGGVRVPRAPPLDLPL